MRGEEGDMGAGEGEELDAVFGTFYPGSRHERMDPVESEEPEEEPWDLNPKVVVYGGKEVEFFTIGALAKALNRTVGSIRKWERLGYIPKATYRSAGERQNRLYTRPQVEGMRAIAQEEGLLDPRKHVVVSDTRFTERVVNLFHALSR